MISDKHKNEDRPKAPAPRTGHVAPSDPELVTWLERLWTRGTPPDRLEVWWVLGVNKDVRRGLVFYENFKADETLNIEQCTRLVGEILSATQNWTDSKRRLCFFEIGIIDFHQATVPLSRPIGPLLPRQAYAGVQPDGDSTGADDDDSEIALKPLSHKYLTRTIRSMHKMMEQTHAVIGDTLRMHQAIILSQQSHNERLQNHNHALYEQRQAAEDRSLDRELIREREKMKLKAIGSGLKVGTNLLYGWFGRPDEDEGTGEGQGTEKKTPVRRHVGSIEQRLVESFLEDCKDEKLSNQLFGVWTDTDNLTLRDVLAGLRQEQPGIFTPQQFGIFIGVCSGQLAPDALDALLPGSGQSQEITEAQMMQAMPLLTQSMGMALQQLKQIRDKKREAQAAKAAGDAT